MAGQEDPAVEFDCAGERIQVVFQDGGVGLHRSAGDVTTLKRVRSASGAKFSDGERTFWTKGREALLEMDAAQAVRCEAVTQGGSGAPASSRSGAASST